MSFSFRMAFQPVVDLAQRRIHAYEALVRGAGSESAGWVLGQVTPSTRYVFDQTCRVNAIRSAVRLGLDRPLHVNFLPSAVDHPSNCLKRALAAADELELPPGLVTFEFAENEPVADRTRLRDIVRACKANGFMTALDDFGAGDVGLALLAEFRPDIVKIDRCLVSGIDGDWSRTAIVAGVVTTAAALGIEVVAEGVERREEVEVLETLGIRLFQGFLFARPALDHLPGEDEICW